MREINSKYTPDGSDKDVISWGTDFKGPEYVPCCSPALAYVLGTPGWTVGKLHEFFGKEHSGKSSLLFLALLDCYKYHKEEKVVALIDVEHRFNPDWAEK